MPSVSTSSRAVPSVSRSLTSAVPSEAPSDPRSPGVLSEALHISCSPGLPRCYCSSKVPYLTDSSVQVEVEKLAMQLASQPSAIDRSDMELLCRALPLEEPHQGQDDCDGAFRAGMYIKGGIVGLHKSCRTHPWANKAIARYVLEWLVSLRTLLLP